MTARVPRFGYVGIATGGLALILSLVHFWAGPFAAEPSLEQTVTGAARSIRSAASAAWKGEEIEKERQEGLNVDKVFDGATVGLGGLAIVLAVLGFARKEPWRAVAGAGLLGGMAVALELAALALGVLVVVVIGIFIMSFFGLG